MSSKFHTEREAWDMIHGPNGSTKAYEDYFKELFPEGHKESLQGLAYLYSTPNGKCIPGTPSWSLRSFHPDAFKLLAEYGQDFKPQGWVKPPPMGEPRSTGCFVNSWQFMQAHNKWREQQPLKARRNTKKMVYVEGIAYGAAVSPMLHAWNALGLRDKWCIDWSHYAACNWTRYFGIPLTSEEYHKALDLVHPRKQYILLLLKRPHFPRRESYLKDILAARKEKLQKATE